jgi:hypothetical protein
MAESETYLRRTVLIAERRPLVVAALSAVAPRSVRQLCIAIGITQMPEDRDVMELILFGLHDAGLAKRAGPVRGDGWLDRWVSVPKELS